MAAFKNAKGKPVLQKIVTAIQQNKEYLSEVDGLIGDGDHGMNMNKGFTLFGDAIAEKDISFTEGLDELGNLLFGQIGGSMGPIYGTVFMDMASAGAGFDEIGADELATMLESAMEGLSDIVEARVGDKTLVDALFPATQAMRQAQTEGIPFEEALRRMKQAAEQGRDSTRDLVAKHGRSSRLGERSRGVLDAGAVSCCILLCTMADGMLEQMGEA